MITKAISRIGKYPIYILSKDLAEKYKNEITDLWNLIPLSNHSPEDILKEGKNNQKYYGKWEHSLIVLSEDLQEVVAFIVGYERKAENNEQYPHDSLHLKSISVNENYQKQGIGKKLIKFWLKFNQEIGFKHLQGDFVFSVQTNGAEWNKYVQDFYQSIGFIQTATKKYENKEDNIYFLS